MKIEIDFSWRLPFYFKENYYGKIYYWFGPIGFYFGGEK
jgi:hypothetical protein